MRVDPEATSSVTRVLTCDLRKFVHVKSGDLNVSEHSEFDPRVSLIMDHGWWNTTGNYLFKYLADRSGR